MKKLILLCVLPLLALTATAKGNAFENNSIWDNTFVQGQVGLSYTFSENYKDASFGDLLTPHVAISAGKHFMPQLGARLNIGGYRSKSYIPATDKTYNINYFQINADALVNVLNLFQPYDESKLFNLYVIAGLGYVQTKKNEPYGVKANAIFSPRLGVMGDYFLNENLSLNLELSGNLLADKFNGISDGTKYDGALNFMVGVTYHFNR